MAQRRALDDRANARMRELAHQGHGVDAIRAALESEGLVAQGTSVRTIYRALDRDDRKQAPAAPRTKPRAAKPAPKPARVAKASAEVEPSEAPAAEPAKKLKPKPGTVQHLQCWAKRVNKAMDVAFQAKALRAFSALSRQLERMTEAIQRMTPPTPPDPRRDPANLEALEELRRRIMEGVEAIEASEDP